MKKLNQFATMVLLTLALGISAFAGEIQIPAPPPPAASSASIPGEIWIPGDIHIGTATEPAAIEALNLLKYLLFVF